MTSNFTPGLIGYPGPARACAAGMDFSMLLAMDHKVWVWGANETGQLGQGTTSSTPVTSAVQVPGLSGVVAIAAGGSFALALRGDGTVKAWGSNTAGETGTNTSSSSITIPSTVMKDTNGNISPLVGVIAIAAGLDHALALVSTGEVFSWGHAFNGQLGYSVQGGLFSQSSRVARKMPNVGGAIGIASGARHSFVLLGNGTVLACGFGFYGQLGTGSTASANSSPALVSGLSGVVAVSGGMDHSLFLTASGAVYGCGKNDYFCIGLPTNAAQYNIPTLVTAAGSCTAITAGSGGSFVISADGTAKAVGFGYLLGVGYSPVSTLTTIPGLSMSCNNSNYGLQLSSAGAGIQMFIPCNASTSASANPVGPVYYANVYSFNQVSGGSLPGQVNWFGLYVSPAELDAHLALATAGFDMVFGPLDPSGGAAAVMPLPVGALSGMTIWGVSVAINFTSTALVAQSQVTSATL
jgi:hypothetical protein